MTIIITGASGFLGTHLIEALLRESANNIIALTSRPEKLRQQFPDALDRLKIVNNIDRSVVSWREVDVLVNCAFPRNEDGTKIAEGLKFIADVLQEAAADGVGSVINISSQSVYSQSRNEPATEETPLNLESRYAVGKYAGELLTNTLCAHIPHTNLRLASLIGAGFDQRVPNKLIDKALAGEDLTILTGPQTYSFLDVRDAADAILYIIASSSNNWEEVYNLGTNESYTLEDITKIIIKLFCEIKKTLSYKTKVNIVEQDLSMNCNKFNNSFSWHSKYSLRETLVWIFEDKYAKGIYGKN